jgi:hypothetical protein
MRNQLGLVAALLSGICAHAQSPPSADDCANATPLVPGVGVNVVFVGATPDGPACTGFFPSSQPDVWATYQAAADEACTLHATEPYGAAVFAGSCGAWTPVNCPSTLLAPSALNWSAQAGTTYLIRLFSPFGAMTATLSTAAPVPNDGPATAVPVQDGVNPSPPSGASGLLYTNVGATDAVTDAPSLCGAAQGRADVWFTYAATASGATTAATCTPPGFAPGTHTRTSVTVYAAGGPSPVEIACDTFGCASPNLSGAASFVAAAGTTYLIRVSGSSAATSGTSPEVVGGFYLTIGPPTPPPANDACAAAAPFTPGALTGDLSGATAEFGPETICFASGAPRPDVWYAFTPGVACTLVRAAGVAAPGVGVQAFAAGCAGPGALLSCFLDGGLALSPGVPILIRVFAGETYAAGPFALQLDCVAPAANDVCAAAVPVGAGTFLASFLGATVDPGPACSPPDATGPDVWFAHVATQSGILEAVAPTGGVALYAGPCGAAPAACAPGAAATPVAAGATVLIRVRRGSVGPLAILCTLSYATPAPNDGCATATTIGPGTVGGSFVGALPDASGSCAGFPSAPTGPDVWFAYPAPTNGTIVAAASPGTTVAVFATCGAAPLACDDGDSVAEPPALAAAAGATYLVRVRAKAFGGAQTFALQLSWYPQPANDECAGAAPLAAGANAGDFAGASPSLAFAAPRCNPTPPAGIDVWYSFSLSTASVFAVTASLASAALELRPGAACGAAPLACEGLETLTGTLAAGGPYLVRVVLPGTAGLPNPFVLSLTTTPIVPAANDEVAGAVPLPLGRTFVDFSQATTSPEPLTGCLPTPVGSSPVSDVWFTLTAPTTGRLAVSTPAGDFAGIYDPFVGFAAPIVCGQTSLVGIAATTVLSAGQTVVVRVGTRAQPGAPRAVDAFFSASPTNDECAAATPIFDGVNPAAPAGQSGSVFSLWDAAFTPAFFVPPPPNPFAPTLPGVCGNVAEADLFFEYVATCDGGVAITTCAPPGFAPPPQPLFGGVQTTITAYAPGACGGGAPTPVQCHTAPDGCAFLQLPTVAGQSWLIRVARPTFFFGGSIFYLSVRRAACVIDASRPGCGAGPPLAFGTPPYAGQTMTLAAAGFAPNAPVAFFASLCGAPTTDLSPFAAGCGLHLDPGFLVPLGGFFTNASGSAAVTGVLPDGPIFALGCVPLCVQAVALPPTGVPTIQLTNLLTLYVGP